MTQTRKFTAREQTAQLTAVDRQLTAVRALLADLDATWCHPIPEGGVPDVVGAAWNHLHDTERELEVWRSEVELNPRIIPPGEQGTWELVQQNID